MYVINRVKATYFLLLVHSLYKQCRFYVSTNEVGGKNTQKIIKYGSRDAFPFPFPFPFLNASLSLILFKGFLRFYSIYTKYMYVHISNVAHKTYNI